MCKDTRYKCVVHVEVVLRVICTSLLMVYSTFITLSCSPLVNQHCIWFYGSSHAFQKLDLVARRGKLGRSDERVQGIL